MSNDLDQDQDRHFVSPDLDPNCLQSKGYQQMTFVALATLARNKFDKVVYILTGIVVCFRESFVLLRMDGEHEPNIVTQS